MKQFLAIILLVFIIVPTPVNALAKTKYISVFVVKSDTPEYNSNKEIVRHRQIGDKLTIIAQKKGWCKLKNGHYVKASSVSLDPVSYFREKYDDNIIFVSIKLQKLMFCKDGDIVTCCDVVTGNKNSSPTPKGLFPALHKKTDANLMGLEKYHVDYYISITDKIGLHDAHWRDQFGGRIYKGNGSHGCINIPLAEMKKIYAKTDDFTKVLVF